MSAAAQIGIVVPVLNDSRALAHLLPQLAPWLARGARLVVVDGGSRDDERLHAQSLTIAASGMWLTAPPGRAAQMNAGAAALLAAYAPLGALWFVHADSHLPLEADRLIQQALTDHLWGRFDVRLQGHSRWLPVVAALMNWRSRASHIATGDQGLFMRRTVFEQLQGYAPIALMEDIELTRRLKRLGAPACLRDKLTTSGRRWDDHGALRTILLMWVLRWRYWWGASPDALRRRYYRRQPQAAQPSPTANLSSTPPP